MSFEQKLYWSKGIEFERERIITLLEAESENLADVPESLDPADWHDGWVTGFQDAIALIKGESAEVSMDSPQEFQGENE